MSQQHTQKICPEENPAASGGVKYILDFDDTIFDAKKLKQILDTCSIAEDSVSEKTFGEIIKQIPDFKIETLLFPDALQFLREHNHECEIVSTYLSSAPEKNIYPAGRERFQSMKMMLCGITELLGEEHIHLVGDSKSDALAEIKKKCEEQEPKELCVFVDDKKDYIAEAESLGIPSYRMNREKQGWGVENFFSFHEKMTIRTFEGFTSRVESDLADLQLLSKS